MLNTEHVIFEVREPIALSRKDGSVSNITADNLIASFRTQNGALAQAGIEADNLRVDDPAKEGVLTARKIVINLRPDARAAGEYQLAFDAMNVVLPRPVRSFELFGLDVPILRAAMVIESGAALLETAPDDPLAPWREAGGQIRFEAITFNWGPLEATGTGAGGIDDQRRLQGALTLPISRPGPIFGALANSTTASGDTRRMLGMLAAGYEISGEDITLDVEARDGVLRLEGLSVRTLPPVY